MLEGRPGTRVVTVFQVPPRRERSSSARIEPMAGLGEVVGQRFGLSGLSAGERLIDGNSLQCHQIPEVGPVLIAVGTEAPSGLVGQTRRLLVPSGVDRGAAQDGQAFGDRRLRSGRLQRLDRIERLEVRILGQSERQEGLASVQAHDLRRPACGLQGRGCVLADGQRIHVVAPSGLGECLVLLHQASGAEDADLAVHLLGPLELLNRPIDPAELQVHQAPVVPGMPGKSPRSVPAQRGKRPLEVIERGGGVADACHDRASLKQRFGSRHTREPVDGRLEQVQGDLSIALGEAGVAEAGPGELGFLPTRLRSPRSTACSSTWRLAALSPVKRCASPRTRRATTCSSAAVSWFRRSCAASDAASGLSSTRLTSARASARVSVVAVPSFSQKALRPLAILVVARLFVRHH